MCPNRRTYDFCDAWLSQTLWPLQRSKWPFVTRLLGLPRRAGRAAALVRRLVHLAKFRAAQELENKDVRSPLKNKIKVTLLGTQTEFDPAEDTPKPIAFDRPGDVPTVRHGDWVFLKIENASPSDLNVAVLDFQPDWGISQVLPLKSSFEEIDSGGEPLVLPLRAWLPDGYDQGSDTLKILAAVDPADFRVLELPALDQPIAPKGMRGATASSATYCPPSARRNPGRATWKSPRTRARSGRRPRSSSTSSGRPPGPDSPGPTPCGDVTSRPSRGTCLGTEPASRARSTTMSDSIEREPRTNGLEAPDRRAAGPVEVSATRNFASPGVVAAEPPPPQTAKPADEPRAKRRASPSRSSRGA